MKRMRVLIVPLVAILVLGMSGLAYAGGYVDTGGVNPHGGYLTTTNKCKTCHAVHRAEGTFRLTRADNAITACDYCHGGSGAGAGVNVYTNSLPESRHVLATSAIIPDSNKANIALYCFTCHSVHGANTIEGTDILKKDPYGEGGTATTQSEFCADCHNLNMGNNKTHPLAPADSVHAWVASSTCGSCHADATDYPHTGTTHAFLGAGASGNTLDTALDNKCILCHQTLWPTPTQGVGKTY